MTCKALANEIAKNLVLAGVGSLTILDHEPVTEMDLGAQFFVSEQSIGQNVSTYLLSLLFFCVCYVKSNDELTVL